MLAGKAGLRQRTRSAQLTYQVVIQTAYSGTFDPPFPESTDPPIPEY